jgi:Flp pilus assembly protein TadD
MNIAWYTPVIIAAAVFFVSPAALAATPPGNGVSSAKLARDGAIAEIRQAIDEQRFVDAAAEIDQATIAGIDDPRLALLTGELSLARARFNDALTSFKSVDKDPSLSARALQGEGITLSLLSRSAEAMEALQKAVVEDPNAWRAWNALGAEYDRRGAWSDAEAAYNRALRESQDAPSVLNSRGYSRLLQNRLNEAIADFVTALQKKPDLSAARTNLRLAIAMQGEYGRAVEGATPGDKAALLNNAGFAAILRGDYAQAEDLLAQAMKAKGEYYARASANFEAAEGMKSRGSNSVGSANAAAH